MTLRAPAFRFSAYYAAVFLALGVYLPFWPLWLSGRGLSAEQVGLVLGVASWARVVGMPLVGRLADRSGWAKATTALAALASLGLFLLLIERQGFWPILLLHLAFMLAFTPLVPLGESQAMTAVRTGRLDYGRMRIWGSLTFVLGSLAGGALIDRSGPDAANLLIAGALAATMLAALALPAEPPPAAESGRVTDLKTLLADRRFLLLVAGASLLQASHAGYYGFSAVHWAAAGIGETLIGWLWAEGVIAEVALFLAGARLLARLGAPGLLLVAGLAGILRWGVMALSADPLVLAGTQLLHALTFGAAHLGTMHLIAEIAPRRLAATAQTLFAAISGGLVMGSALWLSGALYAEQGALLFLAMAGLSLAGLGPVLWLARRER